MGSRQRKRKKQRRKREVHRAPALPTRLPEDGTLGYVALLMVGLFAVIMGAKMGGAFLVVGVVALGAIATAVMGLVMAYSRAAERPRASSPRPEPAQSQPRSRAPVREIAPPPPAPPPLPDTTALRQHDRPLEAWLSALRAVGAGAAAGPRVAPILRDGLLCIVEARDADPVDRAAAAIALASDADADERARMRIAAAAASPRLRVAIERAVETMEDDELTSALSALSTERGRGTQA